MDEPVLTERRQSLQEYALTNLVETGTTSNLPLSNALSYSAIKNPDGTTWGHVSLNEIIDIEGEAPLAKAERALNIIRQGILSFRNLVATEAIPMPDEFRLGTIRRSVARLISSNDSPVKEAVTFRIYTESPDGKTTMHGYTATNPDEIEEMRVEFAPYEPKESVRYFVGSEDYVTLDNSEKRQAILNHIDNVILPNINRALGRLSAKV